MNPPTSYSGKSMKMKDVLFVQSLKKNLLSISTLDAKGMRVAFVDGQVLMWKKGKTIDDAVVIGEQEGGLYKLNSGKSLKMKDVLYVLISALTGTVSHGSNDWLIDSGSSKHMTRFKESFVKLSEHESPQKVKLGDDYQHPIKGSGEFEG